jgi:predicted PurR-regulated permease PerM
LSGAQDSKSFEKTNRIALAIEAEREQAPTDPMSETAKRAFVAAVVVVAVVAAALALWKLKLLISLLFLGIVISAAMRPGVEWLAERRVPRGVGVALHYLGLLAFAGLLLWLAVPRALDQVQAALGVEGIPTNPGDLERAKHNSTGMKHEVLVWLQGRLQDLPSAGQALTIGALAMEVVVGIFFTLAVAAYWIFERERAIDVVARLIARPKRKTLRDTWHLIDLKLGAYVRGQGLLILVVGIVLSLAFWAAGVPYWILIGAFAGLVEIVPVVGPLAAGGLAVAAGLTASVETAVIAGAIVLAVRLLEDYVVIPRVIGHAVALSPLVVLFAVTSVTIVLGGLTILLAVPLAAVLATVIDVLVFDKDPAEQEVPTVLFPAKDAEG